MKTFTLDTGGRLAAYDYLWRLAPDRWAWEYLRRNPAFRLDAATQSEGDVSERMAACAPVRCLRSRTPQTLAHRWGLLMMPDPREDGFGADVFWSPAAHPHQVEIHCAPRAPGETCDIFERTVPLCRITHYTDRQGREFLLLRGNGCAVQVRSRGLSLLGMEPVAMKLTLSDMSLYEKKLKVQRSARDLWGDDYTRQPPLWTKRTQILRDGLVALDSLELGLSQREIGAVLYGTEAAASDWAGMRDTVRYLIRRAERLRDGGYVRELLRG